MGSSRPVSRASTGKSGSKENIFNQISNSAPISQSKLN
jgi:hypothetical protein